MAYGELVRPLEDDWRDVLDGVARARSWPTSHDVARLGAAVAALSAAYNDPSRARAQVRDAGAARLGFAFARDVPKGAAAVRELVATGALQRRLDRPDRRLRVLDIGAGLGATTWGLVRALERSGGHGAVEATWLDADAQALQLGTAILQARSRASAGRAGAVELRTRTLARPLAAGSVTRSLSQDVGVGDDGKFDVILVGQVLSELDVGGSADGRVAQHARMLHELLEMFTTEGGAVVVIEPALRDRSRHLHRVRDALTVLGARIFAPCLHAAPCPALLRDSDWCHEDLKVNLPAWLVPVARAAGLRHEGLTFSYVVLRRAGEPSEREDHGALVDSVLAPKGAARLRVVSDTFRTKGKREVFLCGEFAREGGLVPARERVTRLDRDATGANASWEELTRGDLLVVSPAPAIERPRLGAQTSVERIP
jgi:ribosomal protein RSM22 (predicted rRNA methylase)